MGFNNSIDITTNRKDCCKVEMGSFCRGSAIFVFHARETFAYGIASDFNLL